MTQVPVITVSLKSEYADVYIKPKSIEGIKTKFEMFLMVGLLVNIQLSLSAILT